jgi:hypothetical protein
MLRELGAVALPQLIEAMADEQTQPLISGARRRRLASLRALPVRTNQRMPGIQNLTKRSRYEQEQAVLDETRAETGNVGRDAVP